MLLFMLYVILIRFQDVDGFLCLCTGNMGVACTEGCEAGSYCRTTWIVAGGAVRDTGCITTRTDLTNQQCQTNRKGLVSCICTLYTVDKLTRFLKKERERHLAKKHDFRLVSQKTILNFERFLSGWYWFPVFNDVKKKTDPKSPRFEIPGNSEKCNDASFSIPSDVALTVPPTIKCYNTDMNEDNFCFGHYCTYSGEMVTNDFGDVYPAAYKPTRGCNDDEYNDDLNSVNVCTMTHGSISCKCNTEFCNKVQPFDVPLGHLICYMTARSSSSQPAALKYCRGHMCYRMPPDYNGHTARGCLSVSDGAPEALKKTGKYLGFSFCDENLCNGEYTADAGPIVEGSGAIGSSTAAPS